MTKCLNGKSRVIWYDSKCTTLMGSFKKKIIEVSITPIKKEKVKYLRFRVFQKNSSFFRIIQNPAYSGHFFSKSSNELQSKCIYFLLEVFQYDIFRIVLVYFYRKSLFIFYFCFEEGFFVNSVKN
jgi:hypothetical protein